MNFEDLTLLEEHPHCLALLQAYARAQAAAEAQSSWHGRTSVGSLAEADETDQIDQSSHGHGLLIAYGFLDVELGDRRDGIQYRLTTEGSQLFKLWESGVRPNSGDLAESA
ncbi:hypothetical protein [Rubinisphaera margarita]|uniref:hypothetical protein n=1 Tax=Rubinisphaera margarita TaxID=2909586 RepID=UPI001EE7D11D|nr:hypothetical protein [Rubinisphaera margarita]MCG6154414.1 hypothetical protein [Rubinisphaera margarita]